jgi:peptidoglycan/xylan/chitin deacetylase (PgdA/CDA1 family)
VTSFRVALTFDAEHPDRPTSAGIEDELLDRLAALDMPATFFVQGRWAEAYPRTAARIAGAGHLVGNHSHYHARLPLLTNAGLDEDIRTAETVIRDVVGVDPRPWFRCPFGAGADDPRILAALAGAGYRQVGEDVVAEDWEPDRSADAIETAVVDGVMSHGDGAVVLLHAWPAQTLAAIDPIVGRLREAGVTFATVAELPPFALRTAP